MNSVEPPAAATVTLPVETLDVLMARVHAERAAASELWVCRNASLPDWWDAVNEACAIVTAATSAALSQNPNADEPTTPPDAAA